MKTKALSILMAIFLAFSISTVSMAFAADVSSATTLLAASKKKTVKLNAKKATIYYKGTKILKLLNNKKKVKWYTSNKKVATVSSKGKVTAKGLGTAKITAKVGSKKYTCKVTVKDRNVGTAIGFVTNGGGYFIKGESVAKVTIRPKKYDCAKAVVSIKDAAGDTVYTKTYKNLKKNTNYSFAWNATDNKAGELPSGSYRVSVKIGNTVSNSPYLAYKSVNDFAGGNGSASKPFEVGSTTQLAKIVKYPTANFKQTEDLDFGYEATGGFFTTDLPFEGVYDGNNKAIMNISSTMPLFNTIGEKGTVKNVVMTGCSITGTENAILAKKNLGKITNCNISGVVTATDSGDAKAGLAVFENRGTIANSEFGGSVNCSSPNNSWADACAAGGVVYYNEKNGKIISCISKTDTTAKQYNFYPKSGGFAAINDGMITNCEASGAISGKGDTWLFNTESQGSIAGVNNGQIINCVYSGDSDIKISSANNGTIS